MVLSPAILCVLLQGITPEVIEHAKAGAEAQRLRQFDVAIREFRKVIQLQPDAAAGHANLGDAYFQNGDYAAATPELKRALQLNPNLMGAQETLGVALLIEGAAEEALPHLEKTRTPALLGLAYLETGRWGSALVALKAALAQQPDDPDLLYCFGYAAAQASARTGKQLAQMGPVKREDEHGPAQDIVTLQTALAERPNDPGLLFAFHEAAELGSKQAFDRVMEVGAGSARAHQVAAERYTESGRLPQAETEYMEALRLKPYTSSVHLALGNVFAADGKWAEAAVQFRLEENLRPASADAFYRLGVLLLQQGRAADALVEFTHADRLRPGTPEVRVGIEKAGGGKR